MADGDDIGAALACVPRSEWDRPSAGGLVGPARGRQWPWIDRSGLRNTGARGSPHRPPVRWLHAPGSVGQNAAQWHCRPRRQMSLFAHHPPHHQAGFTLFHPVAGLVVWRHCPGHSVARQTPPGRRRGAEGAGACPFYNKSHKGMRCAYPRRAGGVPPCAYHLSLTGASRQPLAAAPLPLMQTPQRFSAHKRQGPLAGASKVV